MESETRGFVIWVIVVLVIVTLGYQLGLVQVSHGAEPDMIQKIEIVQEPASIWRWIVGAVIIPVGCATLAVVVAARRKSGKRPD